MSFREWASVPVRISFSLIFISEHLTQYTLSYRQIGFEEAGTPTMIRWPKAAAGLSASLPPLPLLFERERRRTQIVGEKVSESARSFPQDNLTLIVGPQERIRALYHRITWPRGLVLFPGLLFWILIKILNSINTKKKNKKLAQESKKKNYDFI